ncbi:hypothetical protein BAUCODRAFT_35782 [Baudoinia panamericana UAMH 10762]|uniref:Uncharacterized protein n=1 Tax=Baudoinia panamericana (strain UAMH 10762) TaxID=717646 RepID=M2LK07_BAUPA|nr:uncharacterized protein BAUCODRAFT_35782 [Baudoinia panamericana UAMH 10762]EMC94552.1 hypothetical protein BAUCODRAFT_35782 [Baudoinia panamericana UAMH 10762]
MPQPIDLARVDSPIDVAGLWLYGAMMAVLPDFTPPRRHDPTFIDSEDTVVVV